MVILSAVSPTGSSEVTQETTSGNARPAQSRFTTSSYTDESSITGSFRRTWSLSQSTWTTGAGPPIGLGSTSARWLEAFGKVLLRGAENIIIQRRLSVISAVFPHNDGVDAAVVDGMYDDLLELCRSATSGTLYPRQVHRRAVKILMMQDTSGHNTRLIQALHRWHPVERDRFITEWGEYFECISHSEFTEASLSRTRDMRWCFLQSKGQVIAYLKRTTHPRINPRHIIEFTRSVIYDETIVSSAWLAFHGYLLQDSFHAVQLASELAIWPPAFVDRFLESLMRRRLSTGETVGHRLYSPKLDNWKRSMLSFMAALLYKSPGRFGVLRSMGFLDWMAYLIVGSRRLLDDDGTVDPNWYIEDTLKLCDRALIPLVLASVNEETNEVANHAIFYIWPWSLYCKSSPVDLSPLSIPYLTRCKFKAWYTIAPTIGSFLTSCNHIAYFNTTVIPVDDETKFAALRQLEDYWVTMLSVYAQAPSTDLWNSLVALKSYHPLSSKAAQATYQQLRINDLNDLLDPDVVKSICDIGFEFSIQAWSKAGQKSGAESALPTTNDTYVKRVKDDASEDVLLTTMMFMN